ncbi:MAG: o-succinylbenzoate synthase [Desulfobacula sp.]|nr:o-succinylbenzoate synthase [Desulfobacula sp.]
MLRANWKKYILKFKNPAGTSRGVLMDKNSWFIELSDPAHPEIHGIGECGILKGLSFDDTPEFEKKLSEVCKNIDHYIENPEELKKYPSIRFVLETALLDLKSGGNRILFPSNFTKGQDTIPVNGLIWMGDFEFMKKQVVQKIREGYNCIKLKIGALNFEKELELIRFIRNNFKQENPVIRVDANGAFEVNEAQEKLERLSEFNIHSIEQPIKAGQWQEMTRLCKNPPIPIALDEELIPVLERSEKENLLKTIKPQFIILKPGLLGGFKSCEEWISLANKYNTGWWITSALESNIGLNAIAQWTYTLNNPMHQGLGTGQLFTNNLESPLFIESGHLRYNPT